MSTFIMAKCWPLQMPPSPKAVLISLADNANDHGYCWPSIPTICKRTCLKRTAVLDALRFLELNQYIDTERRGIGVGNAYVINPAPPEQAALPLCDEPVRLPNQSGKRTSPPDGLPPVRQTDYHQSACRTEPVRQADPNRKEPSSEPSEQHQERLPRSRSADGAKSVVVDIQRGTRLPVGWEPDEKGQAFAELHLGTAWREHLEEFRDHWIAQSGAKGRKVSWSATWRNWVREAKRRLRRSSRADAPPVDRRSELRKAMDEFAERGGRP